MQIKDRDMIQTYLFFIKMGDFSGGLRVTCIFSSCNNEIFWVWDVLIAKGWEDLCFRGGETSRVVSGKLYIIAPPSIKLIYGLFKL
ncbi:MAG: hypothetical protein ACTSVY_03845 [Candidatus Helarchaeota archaeon]